MFLCMNTNIKHKIFVNWWQLFQQHISLNDDVQNVLRKYAFDCLYYCCFDVATKVEGLFTVPTLLEDVLAVRKWFTPCNSDGSDTLTPFFISKLMLT